jgi:hypothetical protein
LNYDTNFTYTSISGSVFVARIFPTGKERKCYSAKQDGTACKYARSDDHQQRKYAPEDHQAAKTGNDKEKPDANAEKDAGTTTSSCDKATANQKKKCPASGNTAQQTPKREIT